MAQFDAELKIPHDFAAALEAHPEAQKRFAALPHGLRRHHVRDVEAAETEELRQRRIEKAIAALLAL